MTTKICGRCKIEKEICLFSNSKHAKDGKVYACKACESERSKVWYHKDIVKHREDSKKWGRENPDKVKEKNKRWAENNPDKIKEKNKRWSENNTERVRENNKRWNENNPDKVKEKHKRWADKNPEKVKAKRRRYEKERKLVDPAYKLKVNYSTLISRSLKIKGVKKPGKTMELLGCTIEFFMNHLSEKFTEGMNFENYGKWHIDHIIPLSSAGNDLDRIKELCHYSNLQPLWAIDNIKKGNKIL